MDSKGQIFDAEKETIPKDAFTLTNEENALLQNVAPEHRMDKIMNLRFDCWLQYNKLKPDGLVKAKMRQAFKAGFMSRELKD